MTETTTADDERTEAEDDRFNVTETMPPSIWTDASTEGFGEYLHLVPDPENYELHCYRSANDDFPNERYKTTIENVRFRFHWESDNDEPDHFYITLDEADEFLSFIDLMNHGREGWLTLDWWEESGMEMMKSERTGIETINLRFTKTNGTERRTQITSAWQNELHKMARFND